MYRYKEASFEELERRWDINISNNPGDNRWFVWKYQYIEYNKTGACKTFVVLDENEPIGEGTLLFLPEYCEVNALRINKKYEGKGHISKLVKLMEQYAANIGYKSLAIGVEAKEVRNIAIYLHWGYNNFIKHEIEDNVLILYYSKSLNN